MGGFAVSDVVPVSPGHAIIALVVADLNDDDIDDVVALDDVSGITVMFGDLAGSFTFGSAIVGGLPGDAKGILVGNFDVASGLDLAVMAGPFATPTPHGSVMVVTGDGAGGFGAIDGAVDLPKGTFGADFQATARCDVVYRGGGTMGIVVAARTSGSSGDRSLYLVRTDAGGVPSVEEIPVPPAFQTFRAADMDGDWLTDLVVLSGPLFGLSVQVLYPSLP